MKKLVLFLLVAIAASIFLFSAQKAPDSNSVSRSATEIIVELIYTKEDLSPAKKQDYVDQYNKFIRKYAHFTLFAVLGIVSIVLLHLYGLPSWKAWLLALLFCALYAGLDEFHQLFVPGRGAQLIDVGLDTLGAFTGSGLAFCVLLLLERHKKKKTAPKR